MRRDTITGIVGAGLSAAGAFVAGTLWWAHRNSVELPCTGDGRGCDLVAQSRWAHLSFGPVQGLPLALVGFAAYLLLLTLCLALLGAETAKMRRVLHRTLWTITLLGFAYSWYLQYVAHFRIGAFCVWCFSSACIMTALLAVFSRGLRGEKPLAAPPALASDAEAHGTPGNTAKEIGV